MTPVAKTVFLESSLGCLVFLVLGLAGLVFLPRPSGLLVLGVAGVGVLLMLLRAGSELLGCSQAVLFLLVLALAPLLWQAVTILRNRRALSGWASGAGASLTRELGAEARRGPTYWTRVLVALAALAAAALVWSKDRLAPSQGLQLLSVLFYTLLTATWVVVPLMTADCISRERREGTLGLLLLTRLGAPGIVLAKGAVHGLRALSLLLAALPLTCIGLLLGGVNLPVALAAALLALASVLLALSAGMLGSSMARQYHVAVGLAALLALLFCVAFNFLVVCGAWLSRPNPAVLRQCPDLVVAMIGNRDGFWFYFFDDLSAGRGMVSWWAMATPALYAALVALGTWLCASVLVWRSRLAAPPSPAVQQLKATMGRPVLGKQMLRRFLQRTLESNPVGWLELRAWSGRLLAWVWMGVLLVGLTVQLLSADQVNDRDDRFWHGFLLLGTAATMAFVAAGSFRRERDSGLMELLLVSPLGEWRITWGRLRGLWHQFLPGCVLLVATEFYLALGAPKAPEAKAGPVLEIMLDTLTLLVVPWVGLCFSLLCRRTITAFLCTLGMALALPLGLGSGAQWGVDWWLYNTARGAPFQTRLGVLGQDFGVGVGQFLGVVVSLLLLVWVALGCGRLLARRLRQRDFNFQST